MAFNIARDGYGQVEPNHLSAPRDGRVYAQLPAKSDIEILEQGMFVKYDYANDQVNFTGDGPWFMVYNEEKLYDERYQMHKHYAMKKADFYDAVMVPRVFGMVPGDIFTTNMVKEKNGSAAIDYAIGTKLAPGTDGILAPVTGEAAAAAQFKVVAQTTMPDGQNAVKVQVIA